MFAAVAGFLFLGAMLYVLGGVYNPPPLRQLDQALARIQPAAEKSTAKEIETALGGEEKPRISELKEAIRNLKQEKLAAEIEIRIQTSWPELADGSETKMKELLARLLTIGKEARAQVGLPQLVHGEPPPKMSNFSGPPPSVPPEELRRDPQTGVPQLPAENSAYLGRSLFTDYLLPVELGGFLLLVAVVGAIAIAQRGGVLGGEPPPSPPRNQEKVS